MLWLRGAYAATPTPELQKAVRAATFEVVLRKESSDPLSYEKPLPLELIPYVIRNDAYWSIGTAFAIGPATFVSASHVLLLAVGSQFGAPALRDSDGHVYPVDKVLKFSGHEDFIVFTVSGAPTVAPLPTNTEYTIDDVVFAVGNALGEGVVIRDGLLTSETPEDQDGRWKWLRFSAAASPGNSGGPLLDAAGRVLGVVEAKSPNENLNYALPIARVLDADGRAGRIDLRYSTKLLNARATQVATLKTEFPLPKSFAEFDETYLALQLHATQHDLQQLQDSLANQMFPKGKSAKLLATVYDSALPGFVQQNTDDVWDALGAADQTEQELPGHGLVVTGHSLGVAVFRLRRSNTASDAQFYGDSRAFMDLLLQGLKLPRQIGSQQIRITSLGTAQHQSVLEDRFGRRWQVGEWPLGYIDAYVVCYALPVPEGYVGMVAFSQSEQLEIWNEQLKYLTNQIIVNYSGTLAQWKAFLARTALRPRIFDEVELEIDEAQDVRYQSALLGLYLPTDLLHSTADSELELHTTYTLHADKLEWGVGGLYLYKDRDRHQYVGVERHPKPTDESAKDLLETWQRMSTRGPGFNGVAGHDDGFRQYWIHDALSAPLATGPDIDPTATTLYDVYYYTDAQVYPRDMEEIEHRLIRSTRVLER
jgi:hypothetical protein